ncbi:hypothetical protein S40288_03984 [Stachybotrys chartarum IBT 40288]|nr:hypothetical protein S40288_03984 [Stachybotrys chartarum IBT 40288]
MGTPKHLLLMPDRQPLYQHQVQLLQSICPDSPRVYVSLARDTVKDSSLITAASHTNQIPSPASGTATIQIIYDLETNESTESAGPASGLLAAYHGNPDATWLVLACDYPFVTAAALQDLQAQYEPPVTCFRNDEGFCEPLVGIWSPSALAHLKRRNDEGCSSPSCAVKELGGRMITPTGSNLLLCNVNTQTEWRMAYSKLEEEVQS